MTDSGFSLRRATVADAAAMWALRAEAIRMGCRGHYPDDLLQRWSSGPMPVTFPSRIENDYFIVGILGSHVAGFAALKTATAEIDAVFVSPDAGRHGLGRRLLACLEDAARARNLEALQLSSSLNAVPFYEAMGYGAISRGTYTTSQGLEIACVRMRKALHETPTR